MLDQARRLDGGRPLYLTVTHSHPEHGFGVQAFRGAATIIYNTAQLEELRRKGRGHIEMLTGMSPAYAAELGDVELTGPDITYDGRAEIDRGGHTAVLQSRGPATASVPARVSHSRRRYPLRETTPVRADLSVARVARDLDVGVHHLLGELPDYRLQHVRARRRQGLLELRAGNRHNVTCGHFSLLRCSETTSKDREVAAWHHGDMPHSGKTVTSVPVTPYTTSVQVNPDPGLSMSLSL